MIFGFSKVMYHWKPVDIKGGMAFHEAVKQR